MLHVFESASYADDLSDESRRASEFSPERGDSSTTYLCIDAAGKAD